MIGTLDQEKELAISKKARELRSLQAQKNKLTQNKKSEFFRIFRHFLE